MAYFHIESMKHFTFFVRGATAEFLNDIKQHSYDKLDDKLWEELHQTTLKMRDEDYKSFSDIVKNIYDSILAEFPETFLTSEKKKDFEKCIEDAFTKYNVETKSRCGCYDDTCFGECGVLTCGCIDVCRNRCGLNRDRYDRYW